MRPYTLAVNAWGYDVLDKALGLLEERDRAVIQENILPVANDVESALEAVLMAAREKQQMCHDKRWTFTIRGRLVRLRDEADKVVMWLDRFKVVGDIAANADPMHAGLPWAGIRLLLEVLSNTTPFSLVWKIKSASPKWFLGSCIREPSNGGPSDRSDDGSLYYASIEGLHGLPADSTGYPNADKF